MKDSGIEWIGIIPKDWSVCRLRYLCSIMTGNQDTQDHDPNGIYPFYVRSPLVERSNHYTFEGDAILMAGDGVGAGKVFHYVSGKYGCHQRVYSLQKITGISRRFLFYYLQNLFYISIECANSKSTVDSVRLKMIQDFPILLPNAKEQHRISSFLDTECSRIDAVIAQTRASIEEYKKLKQSVITQAVTKGIRSGRKMKDSGIEWIGEIPTNWTILRKLSYAVKKSISYGIVKLFDPDDENGVYVLRCSDVKEGRIDTANIRTVTQEVSNEYSRTVLDGGEVLINVRGTLGGCAVVPLEMKGYNIAREVAMISPSESILNHYLMYFFLSKAFITYEERHLAGSVYIGLNIEMLSACPITLPPINEQAQIVEFLDKTTSDMNILIEKKGQLLDELEALKKSLIYEYVTGKKEVPV